MLVTALRPKRWTTWVYLRGSHSSAVVPSGSSRPALHSSDYRFRHACESEPRGIGVSRFTETMYGNGQPSRKGMTTGEPRAPVRHTWGEVHERARRIAGGLAASGVGHGHGVAVLAG